MRVLGNYQEKKYRSLRVNYGAQVAMDITAAWTEGYSDREDETLFFVIIRSGCYMFYIKLKTNEYMSKEKADEFVKYIATKELVILDDWGMALFDAIDTTPDEYYVRNALDEEYQETPLEMVGV